MMASACINNVATTPEIFLDCSPVQTSSGWLSPRISFSGDFVDEGGIVVGEKLNQDDSVMDFEFRLDDPAPMLTADELFFDGKLVPLHLAPLHSTMKPVLVSESPAPIHSRRKEKISVQDLCAFSPKAPRCSSVWKELLGLKKVHSAEAESQKVASPSKNSKSLKHLLHLNSRSPSCDSISSFPHLREADSEALLFSSRASLSSSSSSGADYEDLPRLSLDSDKISPLPIRMGRIPPRVRSSKTRSLALRRPTEFPSDGSIGSTRWYSESDLQSLSSFNAAGPPTLQSSIDSPRLNASGKVIFQGLGRSSSSPNFINGGSKTRPVGMERSYSANIRVTPLLNVPVYNLRSTAKSVSSIGFGHLFSPHKKDKDGSSSAAAKNGFSKTKCEKSVENF